MSVPLWEPSPERVERANMTRFAREVATRWGVAASEYSDLYRFSIDQPQQFWLTMWDYAGIAARERGDTVFRDFNLMPGAQFFPDASLNFAENLLRRRDE